MQLHNIEYGSAPIAAQGQGSSGCGYPGAQGDLHAANANCFGERLGVLRLILEGADKRKEALALDLLLAWIHRGWGWFCPVASLK
jgi:hypothetical protein